MLRIACLLVLTGGLASAQYTLSAMAGYIHYTEGEVWLGNRAIAPKATDFEHVLEGRRMRTGKGRAEILLVPGSFLRVGENTEIEMVSSGLTSAVVRLVSGSVVVDLQQIYEKDSIGLDARGFDVRFRKTGLYRLDDRAGAPARLSVLDGRARVVGASGEQVDLKSGETSTIGEGSPEKLGERPADGLAEWNTERHEKLAVLSKQARKERWDSMSDAERDLLRMILQRPTNPPVSNRPSATPPPANRRPAQR